LGLVFFSSLVLGDRVWEVGDPEVVESLRIGLGTGTGLIGPVAELTGRLSSGPAGDVALLIFREATGGRVSNTAWLL